MRLRLSCLIHFEFFYKVEKQIVFSGLVSIFEIFLLILHHTIWIHMSFLVFVKQYGMHKSFLFVVHHHQSVMSLLVKLMLICYRILGENEWVFLQNNVLLFIIFLSV